MNLSFPSLYAPLQGWSEKEIGILQIIEHHSNLGRAPYVFCMLSSLASCGPDTKDYQLGLVCARIWGRIPTGVSYLVRVASTIAAIEWEDYRALPTTNLSKVSLESLLFTMVSHYKHLSHAEKATESQHSRYAHLKQQPRLVTQLTHGLSRKLVMSDRDAFVKELLAAGRRQCGRADEASAPEEADVLHVALSYKHADRYNGRGTIDEQTAKEAHEVIYTMHFVTPDTQVRVWVDQNLHRYDDNVPWYEKGFIPYAVLAVASVLSKQGGFAIGRKRPWIWVETGLAAFGQGVTCLKKSLESFDEVLAFRGEREVGRQTLSVQNKTLGGSTVYVAILKILIAVSVWTPAILEHASYEYIDDFWRFVLWARAQVVRLTRKGRLDLSEVSFQDSIIERIAWMKALPAVQGEDKFGLAVFLRVELDVTQANDFLSLLRVTNTCELRDGIFEMLGPAGRMKKFCFTQSDSTVELNVRPSAQPDPLFFSRSEQSEHLQHDINALGSNRGGFSRWDSRFDGKPPTIVLCGSIFEREFGMADLVGKLGTSVHLAGERFDAVGFKSDGFIRRMERVYKAVAADVEVLLCETDVLCIQQLDDGLQRKVIEDLWPEAAYPAMRRLVHVCEDIADIEMHSSMLCGSAPRAVQNLKTIVAIQLLGPEEITVRRVQLPRSGPCHLFAMSMRRCPYSDAKISFEVDETVVPTGMDNDLVAMSTFGNAMLVMMKVRLMMGSTEFQEFSRGGLGFALGVRCEGTMRFPWELKLDGSEFELCESCSCVFSPINSRIGAVACLLLSRKIVVEWLGLHPCRGATSRCCGFTGTIA